MLCRHLRRTLSRLNQINCSYLTRLSSTDPYSDYYHLDGYKQIKELEKFKKLIHDIYSIQEHELFSPHNNILDSTEYFNLQFGQFHHEPLDLNAITSILSREDYLLLYDAAISTHCIHIQSRIASFEGKGFYTIGPCGEECLASIGLLLNLDDSVAFHYRHLAANIARNMKRQKYNGTTLYTDSSTLSNIIRDRARGYTVSLDDPISAGGHCLLGSNDFDYDYIITSTLASQAGPAVGRAFGNILYNTLKLPDPKFKTGSLSFVSVGDGSINNSHFLSAVNIVDYAMHQNVKVPLLMCVTNNRICISLRDTRNWLFTYINKLLYFKKFKCDGNNIFDIYQQFKCAADYVRKTQKPAIIVIDEVQRQFGHAATDRQNAYLTDEEIEIAANHDLILKLSKQFIKLGVFSNKLECLERLLFIANMVRNEFETVYSEPKLENTAEHRQMLKKRNSADLVEYDLKMDTDDIKHKLNKVISDNGIRTRSVMRKCMIYAIEEILNVYPNSVYIGEDVTHGGYYLVTDGLADKYPLRIRDFPPDETALFAIGVGYAQCGLIPIVEMPYAKYLDCGADMFFESIIMHWLSAGQQPNGVLFRLQGFGNGLFGGNFHTHNALYIPPGLDVVCYSNGYDYINGWRYSMQQVVKGRCVMSVDCTQQLNNRHVYGDTVKDGLLLSHIPHYNEYITFNDIMCYNSNRDKYIVYDAHECCDGRMLTSQYGDVTYVDVNTLHGLDSLFFDRRQSKNKKKGLNVVIISYGLGVNASRQAQDELLNDNINNNEDINDILVMDVPYLSEIPNQLKRIFNKDIQKKDKKEVDCIMFSDMCKEGQNPLNGMIAKLQQNDILQHYSWLSVAAQYTYNPLGKDLTFLSKQDIMDTANKLIETHKQSESKTFNLIQ